MNKGTDLSPLFSQRRDFTVIALTGRNGSGYHKVANLLEKGFVADEYPAPENFLQENNSYRKYRIIYNYAKENFIPFTLIRYKDIITLFLLKKDFSLFKAYIEGEDVKSFFKLSKVIVESDFSNELIKLANIESQFDRFNARLESIQYEQNIKEDQTAEEFCKIFLCEDFKSFSDNLHSALKLSFAKYDLLLDLITHNIRKSGNPYDSKTFDSNKIFAISYLINTVIKAIRRYKKEKPIKIVIDSLKNPYEITYFKQRFSAFYIIAINRDDKVRELLLQKKYKEEYHIMKKILEDEYKGGKGNEFYRRYVRECIEKADIHITYRTIEKTKALNIQRQSGDNTSPYYTVQMQLLKYVSLIDHPGLITPSPEERCMQLVSCQSKIVG